MVHIGHTNAKPRKCLAHRVGVDGFHIYPARRPAAREESPKGVNRTELSHMTTHKTYHGRRTHSHKGGIT